MDNFQQPPETASILLKYVDNHLLTDSHKNRSLRQEIDWLAKSILDILREVGVFRQACLINYISKLYGKTVHVHQHTFDLE